MADYNFDMGFTPPEEEALAPGEPIDTTVAQPSAEGMSLGQKIAMGALAALPLLISQRFGGEDGWMYGAKGVAEGAKTVGEGMLDIEKDKAKREQEKKLAEEKAALKKEELAAKKASEEEKAAARKEAESAKNEFNNQMLALRKEQLDIERAKTEKERQEKLEQGASKISDAVQKTGIADVYSALNSLNNTIPGGIEGKGDIPGVGDWAKAADLPIIGGVAELALSEEGKAVRQQVAMLRNAILKAQSGGAVTDGEAARLLEALGTGVFKTEEQLRNGLRMVRDQFTTKLGLAQNAAGPDALAAYKARENAIHTDLPLFGGRKLMDAPKNPLAPAASNAIAKELERRRAGATAGVK